MRAPDKWDSARFSSLFLALGFSCLQAESTTAHLRVTRAVRWLLIERSNKMKEKNAIPKWLWIAIGVFAVWVYSTQTTSPVSSLSASTKEDRSIIYAGPNVNYGVIGYLNANSKITLTGKNGDTWVTFNFNGQQGWIQDFFLDVDGNSSRLPETLYVPVSTPTERRQENQIDTTLPCSMMSDHVGELVKCKIPRAHCSYQPATAGSPTFCNDEPYPNNEFTLVIWGFDWSNADGDCMIVEGIISTYQGKPQIEFEADQVNVSHCE